MTRFTRLVSIVALLTVFGFGAAYAGGFQVALQGQKHTGMGTVGAGVCFGTSAVYFNPGAMGFAEKSGAYIGLQPVFAAGTFRDASPGTYSVSNNPVWNFPFNAYINVKFGKTKKWAAGLGVYTPFGLAIGYPAGWKGRYIIDYNSLSTIFIQPTISYKFNDKIGIGVGVAAVVGMFEVRKSLPLQDQSGADGKAHLKGMAISGNVNVGIYYQPIKKLSVGVTFKSPVPLSITSGKAEFTVPDALRPNFPNTTFSGKLTLPLVASVGVGYYPTEKLTLSFEVNMTGWKAFKELAFDFKDNTGTLTDVVSPKNYKNSFAFRLGGQYKVHKMLTVRAGLIYDMSPVPDETLSPELPDGHLTCGAAGLTISPIERFDIDLSFLMVASAKRTTTLQEANFSMVSQAYLYIPGLGLEYRF